MTIKNLNDTYYPCTDVYYVYNISSNSLNYVPVEATIYKSNYLLLVSGSATESTTAESLNVLNIQDSFNPKWVDIANTTSNTITNPGDANNNIPL
ncbi:unnamed protein product [Cunninghamella blakesleeana]